MQGCETEEKIVKSKGKKSRKGEGKKEKKVGRGDREEKGKVIERERNVYFIIV